MILGADGEPARSPQLEKQERVAMIGKESAKLIKAMDNRKEPYCLMVKRGDGMVIINTIKVNGDVKEFLKAAIDRSL